RGPVLVLRSIEAGAQLKLTHPRPVTVLGSLSGQVFGAYRVKAGNLLSGRLEGCRHVEIVHNMGSKGSSNEDAWIVLDATSDPGFFDQAQHALRRLRKLEHHQVTQREATARGILMRGLKDFPYQVCLTVGRGKNQKVVFRVSTNGQKVQLDSMGLLRHIVAQAENLRDDENDANEVVRFKTALNETVAEGLRQANSGGIGSNLRRTRGEEFYTSQVELIADYLLPKLLRLWLKSGESYVQRIVDRLASAPMVLKVDGQLAPFFQIEYPRWKFHVSGGKIRSEKIADCNIACQLGNDQQKTMSLTYTYIGGEDWITQTKELNLTEGKRCKLILQNGNVFLNEASNHLFGPDLKEDT
ncbi:MAG: hypothetical protein ACPGRY_10570, partial [Candidatus Latescibacterota bacterium]